MVHQRRNYQLIHIMTDVNLRWLHPFSLATTHILTSLLCIWITIVWLPFDFFPCTELYTKTYFLAPLVFLLLGLIGVEETWVWNYSKLSSSFFLHPLMLTTDVSSTLTYFNGPPNSITDSNHNWDGRGKDKQ